MQGRSALGTVLQEERFNPGKRGCRNKLCLHCCACPSARACVRAPQCPHATRSPPARTRAHAAHPHARTSRAARQNGTKHHRLLPPTRELHALQCPPATPATRPPRACSHSAAACAQTALPAPPTGANSKAVVVRRLTLCPPACMRARAYVRAPQCSASRRCPLAARRRRRPVSTPPARTPRQRAGRARARPEKNGRHAP